MALQYNIGKNETLIIASKQNGKSLVFGKNESNRFYFKPIPHSDIFVYGLRPNSPLAENADELFDFLYESIINYEENPAKNNERNNEFKKGIFILESRLISLLNLEKQINLKSIRWVKELIENCSSNELINEQNSSSKYL